MRLEPAAGFYRLLVDNYPESEHAGTARAELLGCYNHLRQLENDPAWVFKQLGRDICFLDDIRQEFAFPALARPAAAGPCWRGCKDYLGLQSFITHTFFHTTDPRF